MPKRAPGLYEVLVTESLATDLAEIAGDLIDFRGLDPADAADRLALHVARVVERALSTLPDEERANLGVVIARELLTQTQKAIQGALDAEERFDIDLPVEPGQLLRAIRHRRPDGKPAEIEQPLTPLLDTTVLTNAPGEPRVGRQILAEIASADRIDLVMAFIRRSGVRPLEEYVRVGDELARRYPGVDLGPALELLAVSSTLVAAPPLELSISKDPDDDKFLACALAAKTRYLVSGDRDLLDVSPFGRIEAVSPRELLARLA